MWTPRTGKLILTFLAFFRVCQMHEIPFCGQYEGEDESRLTSANAKGVKKEDLFPSMIYHFSFFLSENGDHLHECLSLTCID